MDWLQEIFSSLKLKLAAGTLVALASAWLYHSTSSELRRIEAEQGKDAAADTSEAWMHEYEAILGRSPLPVVPVQIWPPYIATARYCKAAQSKLPTAKRNTMETVAFGKMKPRPVPANGQNAVKDTLRKINR